MKSFLAALLFFAAVLTAALVGYPFLGVSSSDAFARDSARVDHLAPRDGRLGWMPGADAE